MLKALGHRNKFRESVRVTTKHIPTKLFIIELKITQVAAFIGKFCYHTSIFQSFTLKLTKEIYIQLKIFFNCCFVHPCTYTGRALLEWFIGITNLAHKRCFKSFNVKILAKLKEKTERSSLEMTRENCPNQKKK